VAAGIVLFVLIPSEMKTTPKSQGSYVCRNVFHKRRIDVWIALCIHGMRPVDSSGNNY